MLRKTVRILYAHSTYFGNITCSYFKSLINLILKHIEFTSEDNSYEVHASTEIFSATLGKGVLQRQETFHYQINKMKRLNNKSGRHWILRCQLSVSDHSSRIVWLHSNLCEVHDSFISTVCTLLTKDDSSYVHLLMSTIIYLLRRSMLVLTSQFKLR